MSADFVSHLWKVNTKIVINKFKDYSLLISIPKLVVTTWVTNVLGRIVSETACNLPEIFSLQNLWNCTVGDQEARRSVLQHITATVYSLLLTRSQTCPETSPRGCQVSSWFLRPKTSGLLMASGFLNSTSVSPRDPANDLHTHVHTCWDTLRNFHMVGFFTWLSALPGLSVSQEVVLLQLACTILSLC